MTKTRKRNVHLPEFKAKGLEAVRGVKTIIEITQPLISSEIGTGTSFINVANETGLVVPPSDPSSLRQAMHTLWQNPEMASDMGRKAEQRNWDLRSGSAKLNRSDKCIIGVFSLGKGAGAGDLYEQIIWAANAPRV